MSRDKAIVVIVPIILAIIGIFAGGEATNWTFTIDQSTTTTITDTETNIDQSETNIFTTITGDIIDQATLTAICTSDEIPASHIEACMEWENRP